MHRRLLHSSARSANVVKKFSPGTIKGGYPRNDPALNDSQRVPNLTSRVTKTFPPFDAGEVIEQQTRLAKTSSGQTNWNPLEDNAATEYATTILNGGEYHPDVSFAPGTFVEVRRSGAVSEGIVLSELYAKGWKAEIMTPSGSTMQCYRTDIHFCIPNFISSDLAARCGESKSPENPTQINARVEALKRLRIFAVDVEKAAQGSHMWDRQVRLDLYDEVKALNTAMWGEVSLKKATSLLYLNPNPINYYATHKYLADRPLRYVAQDGYFRSQVFSVRPQREVEEILEVDRLIKEFRINSRDGKYYQFVQKAKEVIAKWDTDPTLQNGRMSQDTSAPNWNKDDQIFLQFLLRSQLVRRSNQLDPYETGRLTLISDIASPPSITDPICREILVKLGVIAPWQSFAGCSPEVNPTGDFSVPDSLQAAASNLYRQSRRVSGTVLGYRDLHATDPLESVRQDHYGRVFVIDAASAEELDDGVSIEQIPSEPKHVWVHVHVADPARYLHPGHALSVRARKQCESLYLVDKSYPLFPAEMMYKRNAPMSLASTKNSTVENRAITFSIKLDNTGDIIDYKLQASILRNVRTISYDEVDAALGNTDYVERRPFGTTGKPVTVGKPLSDEEVADLRLLFEVTKIQEKQRFKNNILAPFKFMAEPALVNPIPSSIRSPFLQGSTYNGFPKIDYVVATSLAAGARGMVAEMMKLAGRVASCVARDNGIPLIRRGMDPITFGEGLENLLANRRPDGSVTYQEALKVVALLPATTVGIELKEHSLMGIPASDGYSRATSPLRRYADLVGQWQLHHILLGPNAPRRPPFDEAEMLTLARESSVRSRDTKILCNTDKLFWSIMAIKHQTRFSSSGGVSTAGNPLPPMWGYIRSHPVLFNYEYEATVDLPDLGISGLLRGDVANFVVGDDVQVRIKDIELGRFPKLRLERV